MKMCREGLTMGGGGGGRYMVKMAFKLNLRGQVE